MIGSSLQHFDIIEKLGEGSMGEVYLAKDTRLRRKVAIKVVAEDLATDPHRLDRFRAEALALASLTHPNIVTIHGVGEDQGVQFLAMEHIEGETLDRVMPSHGLSLQRFLALALPLADAVGAAHAHGITHRDLKPANLMVTPQGRLKVLDFGLAKPIDSRLLDPAESAPSTATTSIKISGTVPYMSPEQLQGEHIGPPSDIFALGIIFFEMAAGFRPFEGRSTLDLAVSILRDDPPSLGPRSALWPQDLEQIIHRCLQKSPEERYPDGQALLTDLKDLELAWLSGTLDVLELQSKEPPSKPRSKMVAVGLGVGAALLLFAFGVSQHQAGGSTEITQQVASRLRQLTGNEIPRQNQTAKSVAVLPFRNLGTAADPFFAAGLTEEVTSQLAGISGLAVTSKTSTSQFADTWPAISEINTLLGVQHIVRGTVSWSHPAVSGAVRVNVELVEVDSESVLWSRSFTPELADSLLAQSAVASRIAGDLDFVLLPPEKRSRQTPTRDLEAYQAYLRGLFLQHRSSQLRSALELSLPLFSQAVELDPSFALAFAEIAKANAQLSYLGHGQTREHKRLARSSLEKASTLDPSAIEIRLAAGYLDFWLDADPEQASEVFYRLATVHPDDPAVLQALAWIELQRGQAQESLKFFERASVLQPLPPGIFVDKSKVLMSLGRYTEARESLDQATSHNPDAPLPLLLRAETFWLEKGDLEASRQILEESTLQGHPYAAWCWFWQDAYERRYGEALDRLESLTTDVVQWNDFYYPTSLLRAEVHRWAKRPQLAQEAHQEALEHLQTALTRHPEDPRLHGALGVVWSALGRKDLAIAAGLRAQELQPQSYLPSFGASFRGLEMAWILARADRPEEALEELASLLELPSVVSPYTLRLDPRWRDLKSDPEFERILRAN